MMCQARRITTSIVAHAHLPGTPRLPPAKYVEWKLSIAQRSGSDRYVLWRDLEPARATMAASGASPFLTAVMIFFWLGQILNQTLNAMIVPNIAPMWMR